MSRPVLAALLLLFAPALAVAQADDKPAATQQDPQAAYDELVKAFTKAISEWQEAYRAAATEARAAGKQVPQSLRMPPTKEFVARAQELAGEYAGKDDAVRFHGFVLKNASNERNAVRKTLEALLTDHKASPALAEVLPFVENGMRLGAKEQAMSLLDEVATNHPVAECKAQALLTRGTLRLASAQTEEARKQAEADLRAVATTTKDEDLVAQAKDSLFEIENLQVGCTAPDIAGVDVEGVPFKLSDYRGKVVLLDFWGFW